jgi:hypothetical protein
MVWPTLRETTGFASPASPLEASFIQSLFEHAAFNTGLEPKFDRFLLGAQGGQLAQNEPLSTIL